MFNSVTTALVIKLDSVHVAWFPKAGVSIMNAFFLAVPLSVPCLSASCTKKAKTIWKPPAR